jgi:hypothetical protein
MEKSKNKNLSYRMTAMIFAVFVTGSLAIAQPKPDANKNEELSTAYNQLELLMASTEESIKYVAPMDTYDDIRIVRERMDLLASQTEKELQYIAPDEGLVIKPMIILDENLAQTQGVSTPNVFPYNFLQMTY